MKPIFFILLSFTINTLLAQENVKFKYIEIPDRMPEGFVWESKIPDDCPFEQSDLFNRVYFSGKFGDYLCGDTFYPTWAEDGNLYSPWTDGVTDQIRSTSYNKKDPTNIVTGHAVIKGDDPLRLDIRNTSYPKKAEAIPYQGRYPAGSLIYDGIWYYATYCLTSGNAEEYSNPVHNGFRYNWPVLGPIPGFQISYDKGKTWTDSPLTPEEPLFPEPKKKFGAVKMGAPHFVDFGKNMEYSPDGKAYLLGMGALDNDPEPRPCIHKKFGVEYEISHECPDTEFKHANLSWISADQIYLSRVKPSPKTMNNIKAYEFFAGHDLKGKAIWSDDYDDIKPLLEWNNNMGCVTATYFPGLKKYIMCITDGWPTTASMDSYFLESDKITGPWKIITYMENFGEQSYFLNLPSKFISPDGKNAWLCHSANFWSGGNGISLEFKPFGGKYGLSLHELRFLSKDEEDPVNPTKQAEDIYAGNIATQAKVTLSSNDQADKIDITDQKIPVFESFDGNTWPNVGNKSGEWVKLEWDKKQHINKIILVDHPDVYGSVLSGLLTFSDGTFIHIDKELPTSACEGLQINFPTKNVKWVKFTILKTYTQRAKKIGISEFAVFKSNQ
ncbi:DUF7402 domain-containing protein [Polaribacter sp. SA4-12]|uniref:DUF7402 domain-containing protein n=1 Tax=Polaribacter sp. SA4-12 TaxID=1312072 RepID=UPI000B3BF66B|nr:hypothetical protein [Polaribacter sp. SA4-12]ARV16553.1 hypothetical protein BTO07_16025 [Polaribacter sp. SA4-12]